MNFELKVKELMLETFILTGKINDNLIINNLINFVKNNKDNNLSNNTNVKGHFTGFKSGVENKDFFSFLKEIHSSIKIIYNGDFEIFEVWGNLCKKNDEVIEHHHYGCTAFSGILYLSNGGPGTYFKEYDLTINEEIGKFVLFHPILLHSVKKIEQDIERITISFNLNRVEFWKNNAKQINKNEI